MTKNGIFLYHQGRTFVREVDMLGEIQMVKWFNYYNYKNLGSVEVIDHNEMFELEEAYEAMLASTITPELPII